VQARAHLLTNSYAAYGEGTYKIVPKLDLTLGARYTHDEKTLSGGVDGISTTGAVIGSSPIGPASKSWGDPTYRGMLGYHLTDNVLAYALYSRGFKSGGYDTSGLGGTTPFQPETVDDYEGGFKSELLNRRLRLNVAYFYYNYKNLQLPVLVPSVNGTVNQVTLNATDATIKGLDLDGAVQASEMLSFTFGLGTLDSKYTNFPDAPCTTRTAAGATAQAPCNVSGRSLSHAPKVTGNLGGTFEVPTEIGKWGISINYSFMTQFYYDVADRLSQGGYGMLNGQLLWTDRAEKYTVALYGQNLANKEYTVAKFAQPGLGDDYVAGSPRMYGIRVRAKF
jgi:iron complex outermembrane receptor protein